MSTTAMYCAIMVSMSKTKHIVSESLRSDIAACESMVSAIDSTPKAYDSAYEFLRGSLSATHVSEIYDTKEELNDIARSVARLKSVAYGYGRVVEFAKYVAKRIEETHV